MPLDVVLGAQWGDEGKGRITDLLARDAEVVARFSGGDNAGHTVSVGDQTFKLHLIPSGIIHSDVLCIIGNGVVLNPAVFLREIDGLAERGVDVSPDRLKIDARTHLITPAHIAIDKAQELMREDGKIGTTLRGIGPAYRDKTDRCGLRAGILTDPAKADAEIREHLARHNRTLTALYRLEPLDVEAIVADFLAQAARIAPYVSDTGVMLDRALGKDQVVLAEGAQGTMLDIDHGTFPFVTSSSPTIGGVITGLGIGARHLNRVVGVAKAFSSRVGAGPFPTELDGEMATRLRGTGANPWDEFGTTTGRPRRVGWLDLVVLRHAVRINGLSELCLTKLDILSGLDELAICTAYECDGERVDHLPSDLDLMEKCTPVYETLPGWDADVTGARTRDDLPAEAIAYIDRVAEFLGVEINLASVGPERDQIVRL